MAYQIRYQLIVDYVPAGSGPMTVPSMQSMILGQPAVQGIGLVAGPSAGGSPVQPTGHQAVPGGEAPTQGNFNTAISAMLTDLENCIASNLAQIQGFATGGG